jgi:hypothetical protein
MVCSLRANTLDWNGNYEIQADFTPLGSSTVTYEVYSGAELVSTVSGASAPLGLYTEGESGPRANPFWKLPDGSVVAVVQLSGQRSIRLPGAQEQYVTGDRILIRAENTTAVVDFASRLDVWGSGGEDQINITQERLGVFNHPHKALGDSVMDARGGS